MTSFPPISPLLRKRIKLLYGRLKNIASQMDTCAFKLEEDQFFAQAREVRVMAKRMHELETVFKKLREIPQ
jgi:hypothetical protein